MLAASLPNLNMRNALIAQDILFCLVTSEGKLPAAQLRDNRTLMVQLQVAHRCANLLLPVFFEGEDTAAQRGQYLVHFVNVNAMMSILLDYA